MGVTDFFVGLLSGAGSYSPFNSSQEPARQEAIGKAFSKIESELHITLTEVFKRDPKVLDLMRNPKVISIFTSGSDIKELLKIKEVKDVLNDYPEVTNSLGFNFKSLIPYLAGAGITLLGSLAFQRDDMVKPAMFPMNGMQSQPPTILDQWKFTNQTRF